MMTYEQASAIMKNDAPILRVHVESHSLGDLGWEIENLGRITKISHQDHKTILSITAKSGHFWELWLDADRLGRFIDHNDDAAINSFCDDVMRGLTQEGFTPASASVCTGYLMIPETLDMITGRISRQYEAHVQRVAGEAARRAQQQVIAAHSATTGGLMALRGVSSATLQGGAAPVTSGAVNIKSGVGLLGG